MADVSPTDQQLMEQLKGGSESAADELFRRHYQRVLNIVWRYLGHQSEAEDLAQEAFLRVIRAAPRWEPKAAFTTWLHQITVNLCLNFQRNRGRRGRVLSMGTGKSEDTAEFDPVAQAADPAGIDPGDAVQMSEAAVAVRAALDELPDRQRMALVLMHYEHLGHAEIAEVMGSTANAVKQMCHRARESLRDRLKDRLPGYEADE